MSNYEVINTKMSAEIEENSQYQQKWQLQVTEIETLKGKIQNEEQSKQRLYTEICKDREANTNLKLIIENSEAQARQLALELEQKDAIYKKLL